MAVYTTWYNNNKSHNRIRGYSKAREEILEAPSNGKCRWSSMKKIWIIYGFNLFVIFAELSIENYHATSKKSF